jgi:hypothetical protein
VIAIKALLRDRKRAQRGSVLSGVLIMVAFLAIISGALMTELSTHFLISRSLVNRVGNEATVNSAMELALDQIQNTQLSNGCPGATSSVPLPAPVTVNARTAVVSYVNCWPTVDLRSRPGYRSIASAGSFNFDGDHAVLPGQDTYLVGDSSGNIYQYKFGDSSQSWSMNLGSNITGPSLAMADSSGDLTDISNLVPLAGGGSSICSTTCVELLQQDTNRSGPDLFCAMPTSGTVTALPAAGVSFPNLTYFGDTSGTLYAYVASEAGRCTPQGSITTPGNAPIVAGPIVFNNGGRDEIYVVTSSGSTKQLLRFTYDSSDSPPFSLADSVNLPFSNPVGMAVDQTSVPARVAITFAGGGVAIVNIPSNFDPSLAPSTVVGPGFAGAPTWCSCPSGVQIGVAGTNGTFYLLNASLSVITSYAVGTAIHTTPATDGVGEWFVGADDGYLYELQEPPAGTTVTRVDRYGSGALGRVASSVQVGPCSAGICLYMGTVNNAYLVSLDARSAELAACLSTAPPACSSGANPRLLSQVEVGAFGNPQMVHVKTWSYYSP